MLIRTAIFSDSTQIYPLLANSHPDLILERSAWLERWPQLMREWHVIVQALDSDAPVQACAFIRRVATPTHWECRAHVIAPNSGRVRKMLEARVKREASMLGCSEMNLDGRLVAVARHTSPLGRRPRG